VAAGVGPEVAQRHLVTQVEGYGALLIARDGTTLLVATTFDGGPYQFSVGSAPITETPTFTLKSLF
jgi:hypothetical protein